MTRCTNYLARTMAVACIAVAALAPTSTAAASPIDDFVDCSDSFWIVACTTDGDPEPAVIPGEPIRIDNDPVCAPTPDGFIICHT